MNNSSNNNCGCSDKTTVNHICNTLPNANCSGCAVKDLSTNCVLYDSTPLPNSGVATNTSLTEALQAIDEYIDVAVSQINDKINLVNTGVGAEIYSGINNLGKRKIRKLKTTGSLLDITQNTDDITIAVDQVELTNFIQNEIPSACINSANGSVTITENLGCFDLSVEKSPLKKVNEGNGDGIIIASRNPLNYGNIGSNAIDLSFSDTASSTRGATGLSSFSAGDRTTASGQFATSLGADTIASNDFTFASGYESVASGYGAYAEGNDTRSTGTFSHAEGGNTTASGDLSHSEGISTDAIGNFSHAEGQQTQSRGVASHAEGLSNQANGNYSHSGGSNNYANAFAEYCIGHFATTIVSDSLNIIPTDRVFNIGNGTSDTSRSNALTVLKNGLGTLPSVTNALITAASGKAIVTKEYLATQIPTIDGSETKLTQGSNVTITGNGTVATPYVINSVGAAGSDGSETKVTVGAGLTIAGTGTIASPYLIKENNLQRILTIGDFTSNNYIITEADNNYVLVIQNGATPVTITIPAGLSNAHFVGYTQEGTADISFITSGTTLKNPIGYKIKGTDYQACSEQNGITNVYHIHGQTKV